MVDRVEWFLPGRLKGEEMKKDYYFSEKQKQLSLLLNKTHRLVGHCEILVDGVWIEYTERMDTGDDYTSKWDDVVSVAKNFDGDIRVDGIVQK